MSIYSMTGFGRGTARVGGVSYGVEIRTVNHRYLDIKLRLSKSLSIIEPRIRALVSDRIGRGRVDVSIHAVGGDGAEASELTVNVAAARALLHAHQEIADALNVPMSLDTATVAAWPGILSSTYTERTPDELWAALAPALAEALEGLMVMRTQEGAAMAADAGQRLNAMRAVRKGMAEMLPGQSQAYRARLERRLRDTLEGLNLNMDEARVLHEVAIFAEKADIAEEVARLDSHFEQVGALLAQGAPDGVGRRLDFLCQEILREVNTVGSKSQALPLKELVIDAKAELERLREQVQNIE